MTPTIFTHIFVIKREDFDCGCSYFIVIAMCRNYIAQEEENLCNLNHFTSIEKRIGFCIGSERHFTHETCLEPGKNWKRKGCL